MQVDAQRLQVEYDKMVQGLQVAGVLQQWQRAEFDNPALPQDILNEAVPGNIRRSAPACKAPCKYSLCGISLDNTIIRSCC